MQLYFLTSVGWSLDANGNLQALNTAGTVIAKFVGGKFSAAGNIAVAIGITPITTTSTAAYKSTGVGVQVTPLASGTILVLAIAPVSNNTVNDGVDIGLYFDSTGGAVPAANAATTGVSKITDRFISATANQEGVVPLVFHDTGLTLNQKVTYYLAYQADTGGTASFTPSGVSSAYITAQEI